MDREDKSVRWNVMQLDTCCSWSITDAEACSYTRGRGTHLALLRGPLSIGIPIINNLVTSRIPDFGGSVTEHSIGGPRDLVAGRFTDEEGFRAV